MKFKQVHNFFEARGRKANETDDIHIAESSSFVNIWIWILGFNLGVYLNREFLVENLYLWVIKLDDAVKSLLSFLKWSSHMSQEPISLELLTDSQRFEVPQTGLLPLQWVDWRQSFLFFSLYSFFELVKSQNGNP